VGAFGEAGNRGIKDHDGAPARSRTRGRRSLGAVKALFGQKHCFAPGASESWWWWNARLECRTVCIYIYTLMTMALSLHGVIVKGLQSMICLCCGDAVYARLLHNAAVLDDEDDGVSWMLIDGGCWSCSIEAGMASKSPANPRIQVEPNSIDLIVPTYSTRLGYILHTTYYILHTIQCRKRSQKSASECFPPAHHRL
jgi:hypothetical protein